MKIKSDEITSVKQEIEQFATELSISEVGQVVEVGDGIARVYGLSNVMAGELLEFQGQHGTIMGQAMNLESDTVGVVLYGSSVGIREGDTVRSTGRLLEVPVGEALLGRPAHRRWTGTRDHRDPEGRHRRTGHRRSTAGDRTDAVRHQGGRLDDSRGSRSA